MRGRRFPFARVATEWRATLLRGADTRLTGTPDVAPAVSDEKRYAREKQAFSLAEVDRNREFLSTIVTSLQRKDLGLIHGEKGLDTLST